jgi:hypothetical protein
MERALNDNARVPVSDRELRRELRELIVALDRRVPRVEQAGEASIARDAALLRAKAVQRLVELEGGQAADHTPGARTIKRG